MSELLRDRDVDDSSKDGSAVGTETDSGGNGAGRWSWLGWLATVVLIGAVIGALLASLHGGDSGSKIASEVARHDRPSAPILKGTSLSDTRVRTVALRGSVTVVNFWASWCGPCEEESRDLKVFARTWHDRGVRMVGADPAAEDAARDAKAFVARHKPGYRIVRFSPEVRRAWGVRGYPETFVIGRDGRVGAKLDGPIDMQRLATLVQSELDR